MRQWLRSHLTYANVMVTILAFLVLGGGTAVALSGSNTVFTDDIANDTFNSPTEGQGGLVAADLRPNSIGTSEAINDSLTGADINESTLGTVPSAQPARFAQVTPSGDVVSANSKGITNANVSTVGGTYCFAGIPGGIRGLQVTPDMNSSGPAGAPRIWANVGLGAANCGAGTQAFVVMANPDSLGVAAGFFVHLYR